MQLLIKWQGVFSCFKRITFTIASTTLLIATPTASPLNDHVAYCSELPGQQSPPERLNNLMLQIRDRRITRQAAYGALQQLLDEVRGAYYQSGGIDAPKSEWHFPIAGSDAGAITKGRKHGYIVSGYDFYAGNQHKGHPSLDIFIPDRDRDCLDDRSGKTVKVISMTAGIVVAAEKNWKTGSRLRGGRYLWVYDPGNDIMVYYAHNENLLVAVGDLVRPGDIIATVGRSGYNAAKLRSPTHLHLTVLKVSNGQMTPVDVYSDLKKTKLQNRNYD